MSYHKPVYVAIIKTLAMITKNCFITTRKHYKHSSGRLSGKVAKNLPDNAGDRRKQLLSLYQEDPLKKDMATHFSILAWKIPWTDKPRRLHSIGLQSVRHN